MKRSALATVAMLATALSGWALAAYLWSTWPTVAEVYPDIVIQQLTVDGWEPVVMVPSGNGSGVRMSETFPLTGNFRGVVMYKGPEHP